jgi:EpsI family protein
MRSGLRVAITSACLVVALLLVHARSQGQGTPLRHTLDDFPTRIAAWHGREATRLDVETLNVLKVSDYVMRKYVDEAGQGIWVYVGYWESQRRDAQMHSPKNCLPGSGWEPLEASVMAIPIAGGRTIHVNRFLVQKADQRELVLYWYRAQGEDVPGEVAAKAAMVKNAIIRNRTDGALVRLSAAVESSVPETSARLVAFVQAMYPRLTDYLPD